jgi:8-oxo-dGTP pyrophosphatase MutT (NUDIX family)
MNNINNSTKKKPMRNKSKSFCGNCGKHGHIYKNCRVPIASFGIINVLILTDDNQILNKIGDGLSINDLEDSHDNNAKLSISDKMIGVKCDTKSDIETFGMYTNNIKFLMIRRKHSLGYIEFIRGRYNVENVDGIIFLFRQMTTEEIKWVSIRTFEELWNDLWLCNKNKNTYQTEFVLSKNKFDKLKNMDDENLLSLDFYVKNVKPTWSSPEWGFPKGRRHLHETDLTCALREFQEESGFRDGEYIVLDKLEPLHENLIGTNGIHYKHIYYSTISLTDRTPEISSDIPNQHDEIGDIGWFTYDQAIELIRPHHLDRKKILTQIYMYIFNLILNISKGKDIV